MKRPLFNAEEFLSGREPRFGAALTNLNAVVQTPEMKKRFLDLGAEVPDAMPPDAIREFVAKETRKWGELIRAANITVN